MTVNEELRASLIKAVELVDQMIQRENSTETVTQMITNENNKLVALQKDVRAAQDDLKKIKEEKEALITRSQAEAAIITQQAESKEKEVSERLKNTKRLEQLAEEHKVEAETIRETHQTMLAEVMAQKEKIRAALAG